MPKDAERANYNYKRMLFGFMIHALHSFDLITDIQFALVVYKLSRNDIVWYKAFSYDYNIAFSIVTVAILGPYII